MCSNEYTLTGGAAAMEDVELCSRHFVTAIIFRWDGTLAGATMRGGAGQGSNFPDADG